MPSFRLTLEYDGADFQGWQVQPGGRTVQGALEQAIGRVTSKRVRVIGAGRTDAGVHAEGQVASVRVETNLAPAALRHALNGVLPADVAVSEALVVPEEFDACRDARGKLYRYSIWNSAILSPLRRRRSLPLRRPLDLAAVGEAARLLVGTHDFASFQSSGSQVKTTVRTLTRCEAVGEVPGLVEIFVEGSGFLRHMVRTLAGTLIEVGSGRRAPDSLPGILAARDRARAGPTAPALGLTLVRVNY